MPKARADKNSPRNETNRGVMKGKPDRTSAIQRKTLQRLSAEFYATLSPVRFEGKSHLIAAISCDFHDNAAGFLCYSDCLAEREGFEPSIELLDPITV